jgi:hypothetical protein
MPSVVLVCAIMPSVIFALCHYAESYLLWVTMTSVIFAVSLWWGSLFSVIFALCHYAESHFCSAIILGVVILSVIKLKCKMCLVSFVVTSVYSKRHFCCDHNAECRHAN